ncbi:hypothetical protein MHIMP23_21610 [Methylobacterium hispanicum]
MRGLGFTVTVAEGSVNPVRRRLGALRNLASCHQAPMGDYLVEAYVQEGVIRRMLVEGPWARGW